jgi:hypothetical protein
LQQISTAKARGYKPAELLSDASDETKNSLLTTVAPLDYKTHVVGNLLTKLFPHDYERMLVHNKRDLEHSFDKADDMTKNYIVSVLRKSAEATKTN